MRGISIPSDKILIYEFVIPKSLNREVETIHSSPTHTGAAHRDGTLAHHVLRWYFNVQLIFSLYNTSLGCLPSARRIPMPLGFIEMFTSQLIYLGLKNSEESMEYIPRPFVTVLNCCCVTENSHF